MRRFNLFLITFLVISLVLISVEAKPNVDYDYMIGTGFLEDFGPVLAMARNGDTIEVTGEGSFSTKPKTVDGGGTFIHRDVDGNVIGEGTWTAEKLITFRSYGSGELQGLPEEFEGGRALMKIHIDPSGEGPEFDGVMRVNCLLGKFRSKEEEGVRVFVRDARINFNEELGGGTLFIRKE